MRMGLRASTSRPRQSVGLEPCEPLCIADVSKESPVDREGTSEHIDWRHPPTARSNPHAAVSLVEDFDRATPAADLEQQKTSVRRDNRAIGPLDLRPLREEHGLDLLARSQLVRGAPAKLSR